MYQRKREQKVLVIQQSFFEAIDEEEFSKKLEETMDQMSSIFNISGGAMDASSMPLPDPAELQNHITSLLDGDLGKLAILSPKSRNRRGSATFRLIFFSTFGLKAGAAGLRCGLY